MSFSTTSSRSDSRMVYADTCESSSMRRTAPSTPRSPPRPRPPSQHGTAVGRGGDHLVDDAVHRVERHEPGRPRWPPSTAARPPSSPGSGRRTKAARPATMPSRAFLSQEPPKPPSQLGMRTLLTIRLPAGTFRSIKPALFQSGGKLSKTYLSLRRETSDRHNMHTVQTRVSEPSSTHHHSEESGGIDTSRFHLSSETNQVRSRFILLIGPELHFDSGIAPVVELDYRIDLQARIVTVMAQLTPQLCAYTCKSHAAMVSKTNPNVFKSLLSLFGPAFKLAAAREGSVTWRLGVVRRRVAERNSGRHAGCSHIM